jgi:hypothetical protein
MKQHPTDLISLIAGLLFVVLGVMFALNQTGAITIDVTWIPAIVLVGLGLAGIASGLRASFGGHIEGRNDARGD